MGKEPTKLTVEEKKRAIEQITDDILNDKSFIYESMDHAIRFCKGGELLTFITMIMRYAKSCGANNEMIKSCYEIASRDNADAIKWMVDEITNSIKKNNE